MIKAMALIGFTLSLCGAASAQIAPPPGAATHQGTKSVTSHTMTSKKMHPAKGSMSKSKATPKPKS
jgi:hypothetical protein